MFRKIRKRVVSGVIAVCTLLSSVSSANAVELSNQDTSDTSDVVPLFINMGEMEEMAKKETNSFGIAPLAIEDDQPTTVDIAVGQQYIVYEDGKTNSTFLQDGAPRPVWPMHVLLSDNSIAHAYCADHNKRAPSTSGTRFTVTAKVSDYRLYGIVSTSEARISVAAFRNACPPIKADGNKLNETNFNEFSFFCASQIAVWAALGDVRIQGGEWAGLSWKSSQELGYPSNTSKDISYNTDTVQSVTTVYAASKMLEYGNSFKAVWEPKGHFPYLGGAFTHCKGSVSEGAKFDPDAKLVGNIELGDTSIAESEYFGEMTCKGIDCYVLPMAASFSTFVRQGVITITATGMPEGAFLMEGKDPTNTQSQTLIMDDAKSHTEYYDNQNGQAYGETLYLCIPKDKVAAIDLTELNIALEAKANTDNYEVYIATPSDPGIQPVVLVEPPVKTVTAKVNIHKTITVARTVNLKIIKKDAESGASLKGAKFKINWIESDGTPDEDEAYTGDDGTVTFKGLPLGATVTITETEAPPGYSLMNPNPATVTLPTIPTATGVYEVEYVDKKSAGIKIVKHDNMGQPLKGAKFTLTYPNPDPDLTIDPESGADAIVLPGETDENGVIIWDNLPVGAMTIIKEVEAPPGYALMNPVEQAATVWEGQIRQPFDPFVDEPLETGIKIIKKDNNGQALNGAEFKLEWTDPTEGAKSATVKVETGGEVSYAPLPFSTEVKITEIRAPDGYQLADPVTQTVTTKATNDEEYVSVTFVNRKTPGLGKLVIIKKDDKGNALDGCTFSITYTDPNAGSVTRGPTATGADGRLEFGNLPLNVLITITENSAKRGYKMASPNTWTRTITSDTVPVEVEVVNPEIKTSIKIIKVSGKDASKKLAGAEFDITWNGGSTHAVTGADGTVTCGNLPIGTELTITETKAPTDDSGTEYEMMTPNPAKLTTNTTEQVLEVTYKDMPKTQKLKIRKVDADTGEPLAGAIFGLNQVDGSFVTSTEATGADGFATITSDQLPFGSYIVSEIVSPEGYTLTSEKQALHWSEEFPSEVTLTFKDYKKGSLVIHKYDTETGDALAGASFNVLKDGKVIGTLHTGDDGRDSMSNLEEGYYQVVETDPPPGYLKDTKVYEVYIDPEDTAEVIREVEIPNTTKLSLRVIKIDKDTEVPLEHFVFELYKDGAYYDSGETDANGEIMFTDLEPGVYRVHEEGGPETYLIDSPDQEVKLVTDETEIKTLTFMNSKKKTFKILKVDAESGESIPGVTFEIFRDGQSLGQIGPTGADGTIEMEYAEFGTYNVKEVTVPPEYVKSEEMFVMEIDKDSEDPFVFTITNKHKKRLTLKKVDKKTGSPMDGVTFNVFYNNNSIGQMTTENGGLIVIDPADPGTYRFEEEVTWISHEPNREPINIEMTADKDVEVIVSNTERPDLIIYKRDAKTKKPLDGVVFEIFRDENSLGDFKTENGGMIVIENAEPGTYRAIEKSTLKEYIMNEEVTVIEHTLEKDSIVYIENTPRPGLGIDKRDSVTGKPLEGVQFHITCSPAQTPSQIGGDINDLGDFFTDANGKINLSTETGYELEEGWYTVTEVKAPDGYIMKEPYTQKVYLKDGNYEELTFFNQPKSALIIWKFDKRTGEALEGAMFEVRKLSDTGTGGVAIPGNPFKTGPNGSVTITDLDPGTYVVQEVRSPSGYEIDETPQTVYIGNDEQAVVEVYFANSAEGGLLIKKVDSITGLPLAGITFDVRTAAGEVVGTSNGEFVTDASGSIMIPGIKPDTALVITETATISGYMLDKTPKTIVTKEGQTVVVKFKNQPKGTLVVEKRDSVTNEPMQGVVFKITSATGESTEDNEGLTASNGLYKTDANGQIVLHNLNLGTYIVTESETLPGYKIDDPAPRTVEITTGSTYTVRFTDTPDGSLLIKKIDSVTRGPIAGVTFEVRMLNGTDWKTQTFVTDENGMITINNLPEGVYSVLETNAPAGYIMDADRQEVSIRPGMSETLTFTNTPKGGLLIKKMDSVTKEPLSDVVLKVTHSDGRVVGNSNGEYRTDDSGYINIPDLEPDTYIIQEVKTRAGYVLDTTPKSIVIKDNGTYVVEFYNHPNGKIIIIKEDSATKRPLEGVEFEIRTAAGELVGDYPMAGGSTGAGGVGAGSSGDSGSDVTGQISSNGKYVTDVNGRAATRCCK